MVKIKPLGFSEIKSILGGDLIYQAKEVQANEVSVNEIGEPLDVGPDGIAFIIGDEYLNQVSASKAGVLIVQSKFKEKLVSEFTSKPPKSLKLCLACDDAYLALALLSEKIAKEDLQFDWLKSPSDHASSKIHPTAFVHPTAIIAPDCSIGENCVVHARVTLGQNVSIGEQTVLYPGVVVYPRTQIGKRVKLHANAVIGGDGFGYAKGPYGLTKIWHLGRVVIGDDVEVGPGTTIDRGTLRDTVVENGVKIDNLVQVGHNGYLGAHSILCAQVGLSGNVSIGKGVILAGKVGVGNKVQVGDGAIVGAMTGVSKNIKPKEIAVSTWVAKPRKEWWKLLALFDRLPEIYDRLKKLERVLTSSSDAKPSKPNKSADDEIKKNTVEQSV